MVKLRDKAGAGVPVIPGPPGKDAYELAITRGYFSGTLEQWLESLRGKDGLPGRSAYELAVDGGFQGTEAQWTITLVGVKGDKGDRGPIGPMPEHEWRGTELRFEIAPNEWGQYVDLKGDKGDKGAGGGAAGGIGIGGGGSITVTTNGYFPQGW